MYVYVYMLYLYIACMCTLFHLALGNEDGGVQLVYESASCLAWGVILDRRKHRSVVCIRTHTQTLHRWGTWCGPRGRDETPGGPEKSRWTKSRHTYIRICVQSSHVYVYAKRRNEILD